MKTIYSYPEFVLHFSNICSDLIEKSNHTAFAFILENKINPVFSDLLKDNKFVVGLDELTKDKLHIFYLKNVKPKTKSKKKRNYEESDFFGTTLMIKDNIPEADRGKELVKNLFNITEIPINNPAIIYFQVYNQNVSNAVLYEFKNSDVWDTYKELKDQLFVVLDTLGKITFKGDDKQIIKNIKDSINSHKFNQKLKENRIIIREGLIATGIEFLGIILKSILNS
jgi:hypothetical protein